MSLPSRQEIESKPSNIDGWNFPEAATLANQRLADATAADPEPRPDLNGLCIKSVQGKTVWLIDRGVRRGFTSADIFGSVFTNFDHVHEVVDEDEITEGPLIPADFALIQPFDSKSVYLLDGGKKRGIGSPSIMEKYSFSFKKIVRVDGRVVSAIPDGDTLT